MKLTREEAVLLRSILEAEMESMVDLNVMYEIEIPSLPALKNIYAKVEAYTGILPPEED